MKVNPEIPYSKLGILLVILSMAVASCKPGADADSPRIVRFDKLVFTIPAEQLSDSIRKNYQKLLPFYRIYNEEVIRIGPDSLPDYTAQIKGFTQDTVIRRVQKDIESRETELQASFRDIGKALGKWASLSGRPAPSFIVSYLSGFNQSFITLPDCLGIGVDNYLGAKYPYYANLGIPVYIRRNMTPDDLTPDAVRAWLYSEIEPPVEGNFLDRMIYEGKIYYLTHKLLPHVKEENLLHYTRDQIKWARENEKAMWKFLAEQKILFSTDRMTVRKFMEEAPFTRDFGNDSPGRTGIWIGYRIVSRYMKLTHADVRSLMTNSQSREILSGSDYHP